MMKSENIFSPVEKKPQLLKVILVWIYVV